MPPSEEQGPRRGVHWCIAGQGLCSDAYGRGAGAAWDLPPPKRPRLVTKSVTKQVSGNGLFWAACPPRYPPPPFVPPLSKLRKSTELVRSLCRLQRRQGRSLRPTHTTTGTHATTKKGEGNAQGPPKAEFCGFKWANNHNKCVYDSM